MSERAEDWRERLKDVYAEGLQVGIRLGRSLGSGGAVGPAVGDGEGADDLHTGDDDLLDELTSARTALESIADDEGVDPGEAITDALDALTRADAIRVAQLTVPPAEGRQVAKRHTGEDGRGRCRIARRKSSHE